MPSPKPLPKSYAPGPLEKKWSSRWKSSNLYRWNVKSKRPIFSIDTPPPYPSGEFHLGNALNWFCMDFTARYKRMRGFEVFFPQGWDCHGLPTEVAVEKRDNIRKGDVPRDEFRRRCIGLTLENIRNMKRAMLRLGLSTDWSEEYRTMDPSYWVNTQRSFVRLRKKGLIYRGAHPVDWCPRCQTAIAHAEVEYDDRNTHLNTILFGGPDGTRIPIATTRPELLGACQAVAVHPEDARNRALIGKKLRVPLHGKEVPVLADEAVDPDFGTGIVMICTFGDRTDVRWVQKHKLPVTTLLDDAGRMVPAAGKYAGLEVKEARRAVLADLQAAGLVAKVEQISQSVGICWRCKTPVEILPREQWFMDVTSWRDRILAEHRKVKWIPEAMAERLETWAKAMEWDWVISRQRIFATPIPAWTCAKCGEVRVAEESELPVDPTRKKPKESCRKCGAPEWRGETDVFDTWMDSSVTILNHAGWPDVKSARFKRLFPATLQQNGTDIIRTWDYYLLVRHLALLGRAPYRTVAINGMVTGSDGKKMSKSAGNYVSPHVVLDKYGADALRQWAALGGALGSDIAYQEKEVVAGHRFLQKLWNVLRFAQPHALPHPRAKLRDADLWLLKTLKETVAEVTRAMEGYQFDRAFRAIRTWAWEVLADEYVELVKWRLYGSDRAAREAAEHTLHAALDALARLLAPFVPFFAEEMFHHLPGARGSVHTSSWPAAPKGALPPRRAEAGARTQGVVAEIRRWKAAHGLPLNAPVESIRVYAEGPVDREEVAGATRCAVEFLPGAPPVERTVKSVTPRAAALGRLFREKTPSVLEALRGVEAARWPSLLEGSGPLRLGEFEVPREALHVEEASTLRGAPVEVRRMRGATVVFPNA
ncbi:MAG: valine--tRNA ligase [Halobacteria archaeon]